METPIIQQVIIVNKFKKKNKLSTSGRGGSC